MTHQRHGLSVGLERTGTELFLSFSVVGKLTHDDYEVITPMLESALQGITTPHIKTLCDLSQFEGWEMRAAWDDFKLGLKHGRQFDKIAIVGRKPWHESCAKLGAWFVTGEMEYFEDRPSALAWLGV